MIMAKKRARSRAKKSQAGQYTRRFVVRDERLLSPILSDYATLTTSRDLAIHTLYQTELPVGGVPRSGDMDTVLVGRYMYPTLQFKATVALFIKQYIGLEASRDGKDEAIAWLKEFLDELT